MYDAETDLITELVLNYFPFDNSCQVVDAKKGKNLLGRVCVPSLKLEMLQIGNIVRLFSKLLLITDCAPTTRRTMFNHFESTFALINPVSADMHGKVIAFITNKGFRIVRMKNCKITKEFAVTLYKNIDGNKMLPIIINYITGGEVIGLELVGPNAVAEWRRWLGATDPDEAAPGTLRQLYGSNMLQNIAHGCHTKKDAVKMLDLFFGRNKENISNFPFRATFVDCTCCVIKPHAILDGNAGPILEHISSSGKFIVTAMAMFSVNLANAEEFFEVYNVRVIPEYKSSSLHLAEGNCVALEVKCVDPSLNCVCEFRKLCGPRDPDVCRQLYPESLRALYGKDMVHNAVHCTDLPEDGVNEVEYFFKLIANDHQ